jgi:hypothetical protein
MRTFAILGSLSDQDLGRLNRHSFARTVFSALANFLRILKRDHRAVTSSDLFDAKIGLTRLAQIVRYASTIELLDYDMGIDELSDHYDPALLEKPKLLALVNVLKLQVGGLVDESIRRRLTERIDKLEEEIRRPRPRWGRIISGFFIIFSFVADLKTVSPSLYDSVYKTAESIIMVLHRDAAVEQQRKWPLLPAQPDRTPAAMLPEPPQIREDEGDDEET